jgi:hypothetical protein
MLITESEADWILSQLDHDLLTDWESGFVQSIAEVRKRGLRLTNKQADVLSRIWDKQGDSP